MNYLQNNFIYLSQIVGLPVIDFTSGKRIGRVNDVIAGLREMYPKLSALTFRRSYSLTIDTIPWKNIKKVSEGRAVFVENAAERYAMTDQDIAVKDTFWDKQVVDIAGSKVVRVNDIHLLREDPNFWVVHIDVGFKGLVRRLGWSGLVEPLIKFFFSYEMKEQFISWKYVQPTSSEKSTHTLALKIPQTKLSELHPADLADILIEIGVEERLSIINVLDYSTAAQALKELPPKIRMLTVEMISQDRIAKILAEMPADEAVDILDRLPKKKANSILNNMPSEKAAQMRNLLSYSERFAGSIMNTEYISVKLPATVSQVWEKIRQELKKKESVYYVYVLDVNNESLVGVVTLRQLLSAAPEQSVTDIMRKRVSRVRADTLIKDVAQLFLKYDFTVLPVVDKHNKLQGTITMKDAFESFFPNLREEAEQEMQ